jgi:hypothetical protein
MPPTASDTALADRPADATRALDEEDQASVANTPGPVPDTAAVDAALRLVGLDPASLATGQPGPQRHAVLLAHLAATVDSRPACRQDLLALQALRVRSHPRRHPHLLRRS